MACSITITNVAGILVNGNLNSIQVTGTASSCDQIDVALLCASDQGVHKTTFNYSGTWTVSFNLADIQSAKCFCQKRVKVTATCINPNNPQCSATQTVLSLPCSPPCCNAQVSTTVDPNCDNQKRKVTLVVLNNCPATLSVQWDFGDGSPLSNLPIGSGATQSVTHYYSPGTYTAVLHIPGCADQSIPLNIAPCQTSTSGDDPCVKTFRKLWCPILFALMTFATAIGIAALLLQTCQGPLASAPVLVAGAALLAIGIIAFILFWKFCGKCLCGWFYLFLWRVLFGVGVIVTVFSGCCSGLLGPGILLILLGVVFLFLWKRHCKKTVCELLHEVILVVAVYILPLVSAILGVPATAACLLVLFSIFSFNFTFLLLVSILFAAVVAYKSSHC